RIFFSSRRRHTRFSRDWSSDVCSSDLDALIQGKSGFLNGTFFLIRAALFMGGWIFYRQYARKQSLLQDEASDNLHYKKLFKASRSEERRVGKECRWRLEQD